MLSACNTIAGDKPGTEALSGLARALFYAGARSLLVSHWAVDSEAAARLTTSTFNLLKADAKLGRAEALRQAKLAYLNDAASPRDAYPAIRGPIAPIGQGASRQYCVATCSTQKFIAPGPPWSRQNASGEPQRSKSLMPVNDCFWNKPITMDRLGKLGVHQ